MRKWDKYEMAPENYEVCSGSAPFTKWVKADNSKANIREKEKTLCSTCSCATQGLFFCFFLGFPWIVRFAFRGGFKDYRGFPIS